MSFQVNSKLMPSGFPREFDAHIYFQPVESEFAALLREKAKREFTEKQVFVGELIPVPIGPHPQPMLEINFPRHLFAEVVLWLMHERGSLNVLVHEMSEDDYHDHTQGALWLGTPVELDLSKF